MEHQKRHTAEKIARRIALVEPLVYRRTVALPNFRYRALSGPSEKPAVAGEVRAALSEIEPYSHWGEPQRDFELHGSFEVPADWDRGSPAALYLPLGDAGDFSHPEAVVYVDGRPIAACDCHHQEVPVGARWRDGRDHRLTLHGWTGLGGSTTPAPGTRLLMGRPAVVLIDVDLREFLSWARLSLATAEGLSSDDPITARLLTALDEAFRALETRDPLGDHVYASVAEAHEILLKGIEQAGPPLDVEIVATGHAHLDVAWLWTLGQTRHKAARTFRTVLTLMEEYPEFHFTQSQPQLYEYVRQDHPELFESIGKAISDGRWEPTGGMWVEADCNITGAESLARQFLLGRAFFAEHFGPGSDSPVAWLPDVFGCTWALPQLIKQAGLEYFMTIKLGWNQYNRLPADTFWWQGIDGTRVLTHFSTTGARGAQSSTYNSAATVEEVLGTWTRYQQKELRAEQLMIFGYGDGGGGPTREMLENIGAMEAFPGLPKVRQGRAGEFFRRLEVDAGDDLPVWNGELYLEYHRGTYTTQARNKRANRKTEFLLHDAELVATMTQVVADDYRYPVEELRDLWRVVCLNQFHDILPGSSIGDVYRESLEQYDEVGRAAVDIRDAALEALFGGVSGDIVLLNPTSFERSDLALWPGVELQADEHLERSDGTPVPTQTSSAGTWIATPSLPPMGTETLVRRPGAAPSPEATLRVTESALENEFLIVELDAPGDIVRIFDKRHSREVLPPGRIANEFQAFEDRPLSWDAWDIDIYFDDKKWTSEPARSIGVLESGPLRGTIEIRRRILNSEYVQRISLAHNSARLDFETDIDWRENHVLLKVGFPVDVLSPVATYDIQWGNIQRPTHRNTSWDWARFETCAHKWVDVSEGDYGVSLLNDCKYGHDIHENVIRLSLLRSTSMPDPAADRGRQVFVYSLLPHAGLWDATIGAAYALNDPVLVYEVERPGTEPGRVRETSSFVSTDFPSAVIETVKGAEDGRGIIVRLYESQRRRGRVNLETAFPLAEARRADLLERDGEPLEVRGSTVSFEIRPYEIVTVRLIPAP
ncbi:MAG TPA: alpha-mannosidase [Actinomycetota bacterium]|nr:alpha-mannosidase [Actinomycetota bacterium]